MNGCYSPHQKRAAGREGEEGAEGQEGEEFELDCHDLSLENVFVDEVDHTKIVSGLVLGWGGGARCLPSV